MNADQQRLEQLLATKPFDELTPEERELVYRQLGSEEQYTLAREVSLALVRDTAHLSPDPWVLDSLQHRFRLAHQPPLWQRILATPVPAYAMAIACLMLAAVVWMLSRYSNAIPKPAPTLTVVVRDTVYVAGPRDTVFRQRVVYRTRIKVVETPVYVNVPVEASLPPTPMESVSMKEKEELEKLLVSGSGRE